MLGYVSLVIGLCTIAVTLVFVITWLNLYDEIRNSSSLQEEFHSTVRRMIAYTLDIWAWKTGTEVASDGFKLEIPTSAKQLTPGEVAELNASPDAHRRICQYRDGV